MPESPKLTDVPPLAIPRWRGWFCLRCLTLRGINMIQPSVLCPSTAGPSAGAAAGGIEVSSALDAARPASVLVAVVPADPLRRGRVPDGRSRRGPPGPGGGAARGTGRRRPGGSATARAGARRTRATGTLGAGRRRNQLALATDDVA